MDLNADLGESWYQHKIGKDDKLMPLLTSCNIACGLHGGDALTIRKTIELALRHGVAMGAHPSYPDRENFGRRKMTIPSDRLSALLDYQVAALSGMVGAAGGQLRHLKAHGSLYHEAAFGQTEAAARALIDTAIKFGRLDVYGPQGSHLERLALVAGLNFVAEGFVDRRYQAYNKLVARRDEGAVIVDPDQCAGQALDIARGTVRLADGETATIAVQTLCGHGDHRGGGGPDSPGAGGFGRSGLHGIRVAVGAHI